MSDQGPHWSPPGGDEPPPPPPPPEAGVPTYGHTDWQPPAKTRRTGLIVGIVVAVVAIPLVLGGIALLAVRGGEVSSSQDAGGASGESTTAPSPAPPGDEVAQAEAILQAIDGSEERMIAFQREVFEDIGQDGTVGEAAEEVAQAAQVAGNDLTELRSQLRGMADEGDGASFDALREVRDSYAEHMTAWIDYLDAVAGSPALASPQSDEDEEYMREINSSGEVFVEAVEDLPDDLPDRLLDLADMIVERGFSSGSPSGNLVRLLPDAGIGPR